MVLLVENQPPTQPNSWPRPATTIPSPSGSAPSKPKSCGLPSALTAPWTLFRQLLSDVQGTELEALAHQYLGRAYYASGNTSAAVDEFAKALDLRVARPRMPR